MIRTLQVDALIVFLSDTHIGGDEGHDIFESPEELTALLEELSAHVSPVELILAGDFFDFLEIGEVQSGENRASTTISRPEYRKLFSALRIFARGEDRRVIYLPGNHDAEVWWNPAVQKTLREEGLVDEFALSYATRFDSVPERIVYCEHGNQFDPANTIKDYEDPLDTPLGDHIVTDLTRGLVAAGRITRNLDLRDVNKVYPLATIPEWVVGRFFYDLLGRVVTYLLVPLIVGYAAYWIVEYLLTVAHNGSAAFSFWESYRTFPGPQRIIAEIATDASLLVVAFGLFFLAVLAVGGPRSVLRVLAAPGPPAEHPSTSCTGARNPRSAEDRPASADGPRSTRTGHRHLHLGAHPRSFALGDPVREWGCRDHRELRLLA